MSANNLKREILEQPEALQRVYQAYIEKDCFDLKDAARLLQKSPVVYMAGMATSEYGCFSASALLSKYHKPNFVYDVSELLYYHREGLPKDACLVVVSQSGESAEIVRLLDEIKGHIPVIGVFNNENSTLAKGSTVGLPIYAGSQLACGSKTNITTLAVMNLLAEAVLGRDLKKAGEQILKAKDAIQHVFDGWELTLTPAVDFLEGSTYTVFVGRGPGRASAMFSACLFREVPKLVAEGIGAAAFRHGLREMILPGHRVVIFAPGGVTTPYLVGLAEDMLKINIPALVITNQDLPLKASRLCQIVRTDPLDEIYAPIVDIVPPQLIGYLLALKRGLEPGKLEISTYITRVE